MRLAVDGLEDRVNPVSVSIASLGDITEGGSAGTFRFTRDDTCGLLDVAVPDATAGSIQ